MARSQADLVALKAELTNDPKTLGLTLIPADDVANADKLNLVRPELQIDREAIPTTEIFLQIDRDEYAALGSADRQWLNGVSQGGTINPRSGGEVREGLLQLFGAGTETRANLQAILTENASRIEQMFKEGLLEQGGNVTPSDVANARQV
jgi:hypothetical protein